MKRLLRQMAALLFLTFALPGVAATTTLYTTDPVFNIAGDGQQDDSDALQSAFKAAASANATLSISGTIRTTKNLFVYGNCNIVGSGSTSVILCDADLGATDKGRLYWISVGITNTSFSGTDGIQQCFTGTISNLCLKASDKAKFNRGLFVFNTNSLNISNVLFDFCLGTSGTDASLFGAIATGYNGAWAPSGKQSLTNINILNNRVEAKHTSTGSEGISVSFSSTVNIFGNVVRGVGDDPIACHTVINSEIKDNECYSLDGRILVTNSSTSNIHDNYCERIAGPDGTWYGNGAMIMASLEGSGSTSPAPSHITIKNNVIFLPFGVPTYTYGIRIRGGIDVDIASNRLVMSATGGGGGIRVEDDNSIPNWTGSNTNAITGGVAKPQTITIENNICEGTYPGSIEESGTVDTLPGPYFVKKNTAGGYFWYTSGTEVQSNNLLTNGRYQTFKVPLSSMADTSQLYTDNLNNVKANILINGTSYSGTRAGRIIGFSPQFTSFPTSGWINVKLFKNSGTSPLSVSTISTNQPVILDRTNPCFAFKPGDTFRIKAIGSSNLQPLSGVNLPISILGIETDLSLFYAFDGAYPGDTTIGYDASGNGNLGTPVNCALAVGARGQALSLTGSGEITVPDKASLEFPGELSICFWINASQLPSNCYAAHVIKKSYDTAHANFDCYYFGPAAPAALQGKIAFMANAGGTWTQIALPYSLPQNTWVHVALVYSPKDGGILYINGNLIPTNPPLMKYGGGALATNPANLTIGTDLIGLVDQVRVYNRVLSADEVETFYKLQE